MVYYKDTLHDFFSKATIFTKGKKQCNSKGILL